MPSVDTKKMRSCIEWKQFQKTFWNSRTIRILKGQLQNKTPLSCSPTHFWGFRCRHFWRKNLWWQRSLNLQNEKRDRSVWNELIGGFAMLNFQGRGRKLWLSNPIQRYTCQVSNWESFCKKIKIQPVVAEKDPLNYLVQTFSRNVSEFSHKQDFEGSNTKHQFSCLISYTTLRFPMQNFFGK